jgi:hypothetical protein
MGIVDLIVELAEARLALRFACDIGLLEEKKDVSTFRPSLPPEVDNAWIQCGTTFAARLVGRDCGISWLFMVR